jgi:hypothetical protein
MRRRVCVKTAFPLTTLTDSGGGRTVTTTTTETSVYFETTPRHVPEGHHLIAGVNEAFR